MSEEFKIEIVNPEKSFLSKDDVTEVIVPGSTLSVGVYISPSAVELSTVSQLPSDGIQIQYESNSSPTPIQVQDKNQFQSKSNYTSKYW